MKIMKFKAERDLDLYLEGDIAAFKESFPGITISHDLESQIRSGIYGIESHEDIDAFTLFENDYSVGFVVVSMQWFYCIPQGYIDSIYVRNDYRKKGHGKALLAKAEEWAVLRGAKSIRLDVSISNQQAVVSYEKSGFSSTRVQMERTITLR